MRAITRTRKLLLLSVVASSLGIRSAAAQPTVTVWDFAARDNSSSELTQSYTDAFELALSQQGLVRVVERRRFDRFRSKLVASRTIAELMGAQPDVIANGRVAGVSAFIFGELFDDQQGGEFHIDVTVQQLDTVILAREESFMPRARRADPESRRTAMADLARKVANRLGGTKAEPLSPKPAEPPVRAAFVDRYVRFVLTSLSVAEDVSVGLTIQNITNASLRLSSTACLMWQMVDSSGKQFRLVNSIGLAHQQCGEGGINTGQPVNESRFTDFEPGAPVPIVLRFRSYDGRGTPPFTVSGEIIRSVGRGHQTFAVVLQGLTR